MMFYLLIQFENLVRSEDDIIDGVASMTTWVTPFGATAWEFGLSSLDGGSGLYWNVGGVADYFQGVEWGFADPEK